MADHNPIKEKEGPARETHPRCPICGKLGTRGFVFTCWECWDSYFKKFSETYGTDALLKVLWYIWKNPDALLCL